MKRRTLIWLLVSPLSLLILLATLAMAAAYSLLHTEAGARWALLELADSVPGSLEWSRLEGNLGDGLVLHDVRFQDREMRSGIDRLEISAGVWLSPLTVQVRRLVLTNSRIEALSGQAQEPMDLEQLLPELSVPVAVEIAELEVNGFNYLAAGQDSGFKVDSLVAKARLKDKINIERLELSTPQASLLLEGSLGLNAPFPFESDIDLELAGPMEGGPDEFALHADLEGELYRYQVSASAVFAADSRSSHWLCPNNGWNSPPVEKSCGLMN
jgi:autotransporter translocation and assembly factor TamB